MGVPGIEINGDRSRWVILLAEQSDRSFFRTSKHEQGREREREREKEREKEIDAKLGNNE